MRRCFIGLAVFTALLLCTGAVKAQGSDALTTAIAPLLEVVAGKTDRYAVDVTFRLPVAGHDISAAVQVVRYSDESFKLTLDHETYGLEVLRTPERTVLLLPGHDVAFVGEGPAAARPGKPLDLVSRATSLRPYAELLQSLQPAAAAQMLMTMAMLREHNGVWESAMLKALAIYTDAQRKQWLEIVYDNYRLEISGSEPASQKPAAELPPQINQHAVDRDELERVLVRGVRRALEVLAPAAAMQVNREVPNGRKQWIHGHRVVTLWGTPQQIGRAHGTLLAPQIMHCADSTVHLVALAEAVRSGRWIHELLREARDRTDPFTPSDHLDEIEAIASAAQIDHELLLLANVFPELFHCSGFALFGSATQDAELYHGRVLDYMTEIGLDQAATIFIMHPDGKIPFVNVGYAGFVGSVTGMNAKQVSMGEMGGAGLGDWDGVPMASLMRMALESCSTLDEVKQLWTQSPRTCEYFYVFADGKIPDAVGVAATADSISFVRPGEAHPMLGDGIADAVVLSSGNRLQELRSRIIEYHGRIDHDRALWLMSRPVAMRSNLHNVLFVPRQLVIYVAHAKGRVPAAEQPYARFELAKRLADWEYGR